MRPFILLVCAAALWGIGQPVLDHAIDGLPAVTAAEVAIVTGAAAVWAAVGLREVRTGHPLRRPRNLARLVLAGALEPGLANLAIAAALVTIPASICSVLAGTEPVFTLWFSILWLGHGATRRGLAAVLLVVLGTVFLNRPDLDGGLAGLPALGGITLALLAAISAAGFSIIVATPAKVTDPLTLTAVQFLVAATVLLPALGWQLWHAGTLTSPTATSGHWLAAVAAGALGMTLPFLLYTTAIGTVHVFPASLTLTLIPVFGVLTALVFRGERLDGSELTGTALIVAALGLYLSTERESDASSLLEEYSVPRHHRTIRWHAFLHGTHRCDPDCPHRPAALTPAPGTVPDR